MMRNIVLITLLSVHESGAHGRVELQAFANAKGAEILGLNNALVRLKKEVEERCEPQPVKAMAVPEHAASRACPRSAPCWGDLRLWATLGRQRS